MSTTSLRGLAPAALLALLTGCPAAPTGEATAPTSPAPATPDGPSLKDPRERHFGAVRQITRGAGDNGEAYWSFDGRELIFQSERAPYACDQIFRVPADGSAPPTLVSTGKGETTCSYFFPGESRVLYASTHEHAEACPTPPDRSQGYVWPLFEMDIYAARPDGRELTRLTGGPGYDAEATVCGTDGSIVFTSVRDGDLELYRMERDGGNVKRLTAAPGYDGGAFFSADCSKLVWRASRPEGDALADYQRLLKQGLVRPSQLEIYVADVTPDGLASTRQVTHLGGAAFGPFFHPSGTRVLFSSNHGDPRGREFDIWAIDVDGTDLEQITFTPGFDGFPMFSPDGKHLAFGSNRNQASEGETDIYVAEWIDGEVRAEEGAADRFLRHATWLADDAREGRGVGTKGLAASADWLERELRALGVEPGMGGGFRQELEVIARQAVGPGTALTIGGAAVAADAFVPASASATGEASGKTVFVGYGIVAPELKRDDYRGKRVKGKIAVARRHVPRGEPFDDPDVEARYSDLATKAAEARRRGAIALIVVDQPEGPVGAGAPEESELPALERPPAVDAGIPVVVVTRAAGSLAIAKVVDATVKVELVRTPETVANIVGVVRAGARDALPGAIVVGAHYDHLGFGGDRNSLEPGVHAPHNGANDNASGVAGLLEIARTLVARRGELRRDVYVVGFTAEEIGVLGSDHFVKQPPPGLALDDVVAMINLDMIGRLADKPIGIQGVDTAAEWGELVKPACAAAKARCNLIAGGLGPSDHRAFYAAGRPVLFFFDDNKTDYHKTTDDADKLDAAGGAKVAAVAAEIAIAAARRDGRLTYQRTTEKPMFLGDKRARGAGLGTVPSYSDGKPGVLLDGVTPGSPAEKAGLRRGDRLVAIDGREVRTVAELMQILTSSIPGTRTKLRVERDGKALEVDAVFGKPRRR